jgi:hypothetical protein
MAASEMVEVLPAVPLKGGRGVSIENTRKWLASRLSMIWRSPGDERDSTLEIVHRRSGAALDERTVHRPEDTPHTTAAWVVGVALEYMRSGGIAQSQAFDVIMDGTFTGFWLHPEGGELNTSPEAIISQVLQHHEQMFALYTQGTEKLMTTLSAENSSMRGTISDLSKSSVESARAVGEVYRAQNMMELEVQRQRRADDRLDRVANSAMTLVESAGPVALQDFMRWMKAKGVHGKDGQGQEASGKQYLEDVTLGELAASLTEKEKQVLGVLVHQARQREIDAQNKKAAAEASKGAGTDASKGTESAPTGTTANGAATSQPAASDKPKDGT